MIVLLLCLQRNGIGQETVKIKRITSAIEFDGIPGEAAWQTHDLFPLTMHKPNYGAQPSEISDVRIGYDNEFLWIGASLYMKDASNIMPASISNTISTATLPSILRPILILRRWKLMTSRLTLQGIPFSSLKKGCSFRKDPARLISVWADDPIICFTAGT